MKELLFQLQEWSDNIKYDAIHSDMEDHERTISTLQHTQLTMAIALLSNLGENTNIPE